MDIEVQFHEDREPDGDWQFVPATYLHPEIRKSIEGLLQSPYIDMVEITYNINTKHVLSSKFRQQVVTVTERTRG